MIRSEVIQFLLRGKRDPAYAEVALDEALIFIDPKGYGIVRLLERFALKASLSVQDFRFGKCERAENIKLARWECWYHLRTLGFTLKRIGELFNRSHSSIHHGIISYCSAHNIDYKKIYGDINGN